MLIASNWHTVLYPWAENTEKHITRRDHSQLLITFYAHFKRFLRHTLFYLLTWHYMLST